MDTKQPKNLVHADFTLKVWVPSDEHLDKMWDRLQASVIIPIPPEIETQIINVDFINKRKVG